MPIGSLQAEGEKWNFLYKNFSKSENDLFDMLVLRP